MTKNHPDSARLIWVKSFLAFASCGNAEQAEKELGYVATGIQRHIAYLEVWLGRKLITDENPSSLWEDGVDFAPLALQIWALIKEGFLEDDLSRLVVLPDGRMLRDGYISNNKEACCIGQILRGHRSFIKPRTQAEALHAKADRLHRFITLNLQNLRRNISLYEKSPVTRPRMVALASIRRRVHAGERMIEFLNDKFGPFERTSGASIDMSCWASNSNS